jgi:hypothetical protein
VADGELGAKGATVRTLAAMSCSSSLAVAWDFIDANPVKPLSQRHIRKSSPNPRPGAIAGGNGKGRLEAIRYVHDAFFATRPRSPISMTSPTP